MTNPDQSNEWQQRLRLARRIVVKLGTNIVADESGRVALDRMRSIVQAIATLRDESRQIVLVSSGAVSLGARHLALSGTRLQDLVTKQACAAVGQSLLMRAFEELFGAHKTKIAQVLLTEDDFANWSRYQNLRRTMERLLKLGVLPIVNENDTVSGEEIEQIRADGQRVFSDNDVLSALVMSKLDAEVLVLLTSVDGLMQQPLPQKGQVLKLVREITPEIEALAAGPSPRGRGGMITKLEAAKIAMCSGVCVIANGKRPDTLPLIFAGEPPGTVFVPTVRVRGRRRWIAFTTRLRGQLTVNEGAREAILKSKASLLASGVIEVVDQFVAGEVVSIVDQERVEFARGIVNCDSDAIEQMKQKQRKRAKDHVVITRDNIVLNPG